MRRIVAAALPALLLMMLATGCSKKSTTAPTPTAVVSGVVRHLDGTLYPSALVDAQTLALVSGAYEITTVTSDTAGAFTFAALRPGAGYTISVVEFDSLAVADTVTAPASGVALRLQPGVVIRGVALRPGVGADLNGVIIETDLPTVLALTDTTGAFELRGVAPGHRRVLASDPLTSTGATAGVTAVAGDTLVLDTLRLGPVAVPTARLTRR